MSVYHAQARIDERGDLRVHLGLEQAGRQVDVRVEPLETLAGGDAYRSRIKKLAGAWRGDFSKPANLPFEKRSEME